MPNTLCRFLCLSNYRVTNLNPVKIQLKKMLSLITEVKKKSVILVHMTEFSAISIVWFSIMRWSHGNPGRDYIFLAAFASRCGHVHWGWVEGWIEVYVPYLWVCSRELSQSLLLFAGQPHSMTQQGEQLQRTAEARRSGSRWTALALEKNFMM